MSGDNLSSETLSLSPPCEGSALPPPWDHDAEELRRIRSRIWPGGVRRREEDAGAILQVDLRILVDGDLGELYALHRLVVDRLPHPHVFRADNLAFMRRHIGERGWTVGAFLAGELIGYAVVAFPRGEADNLGRDLPLPKDLRPRAAHFDGSAVHPDYRGSLLHRQMNSLRARVAVAGGYHQLFGTVSPLNPYSLRNHFAAGFMVKGHVVKYGGMDRLLIHRDGRLRPDHGLGPQAVETPPRPEGEILVGLEDVAAQAKLLEEGFWGWRLEVIYGQRAMIAYAPAALLSTLTRERQPAAALRSLRPETGAVVASLGQEA